MYMYSVCNTLAGRHLYIGKVHHLIQGRHIHVYAMKTSLLSKVRYSICKGWQNCFYEHTYSLWIKIYIKGRYNIGNVGITASMSMLTLFESRYTLKGRYNIGNVGKTASMSMLTLFESGYTSNYQSVRFSYNVCSSWENNERYIQMICIFYSVWNFLKMMAPQAILFLINTIISFKININIL